MTPAFFISHGSPMLAVEDSPAHRFLVQLGRELERPRAILVVSAHWETHLPAVSVAARPETIHDFGGFPRALYEIEYPAPGAPDVAARAAQALAQHGLDPLVDPQRGLDHGAWVPLLLMFPDAGIPVTQLSVQSGRDAAHHRRVGEALRGLREEGVMILASGSITHNLRAFFRGDYERASEWVQPFVGWLSDKVAARDTAALDAYRTAAPFAEQNHPTDEHLLPLFVAVGASAAPGRRVFGGGAGDGAFVMDCYRFD
jgi:4,5-DOPA dioxygenase extradiol